MYYTLQYEATPIIIVIIVKQSFFFEIVQTALNIVTLSVSCFFFLFQFDNGTQPACFTRDLQLKINSRDSKPTPFFSFRNFSGKKLGQDE